MVNPEPCREPGSPPGPTSWGQAFQNRWERKTGTWKTRGEPCCPPRPRSAAEAERGGHTPAPPRSADQGLNCVPVLRLCDLGLASWTPLSLSAPGRGGRGRAGRGCLEDPRNERAQRTARPSAQSQGTAAGAAAGSTSNSHRSGIKSVSVTKRKKKPLLPLPGLGSHHLLVATWVTGRRSAGLPEVHCSELCAPRQAAPNSPTGSRRPWGLSPRAMTRAPSEGSSATQGHWTSPISIPPDGSWAQEGLPGETADFPAPPPPCPHLPCSTISSSPFLMSSSRPCRPAAFFSSTAHTRSQGTRARRPEDTERRQVRWGQGPRPPGGLRSGVPSLLPGPFPGRPLPPPDAPPHAP